MHGVGVVPSSRVTLRTSYRIPSFHHSFRSLVLPDLPISLVSMVSVFILKDGYFLLVATYSHPHPEW